MENILTLNQSIFGTKTVERKISRRALKASVQELYVPQESEEITYDEGYDIDGGWFVGIDMSAAETREFYNDVMSKFQGSGLTATGIAGYAFTCFKSSKYYMMLTSTLSAIPVWGWVALGVVAAGGVTIAGAIFAHGKNNVPMKVGVEVTRGFMGIPKFQLYCN